MAEGVDIASGQVSNLPPEVAITWPSPYCDAFRLYGRFDLFKLRAEASDPDGMIAEVQFFEETTLIGTVTNPPYAMWWHIDVSGSYALKAVAFDDSGASNATSVVVIVSEFPSGPRFEIQSPPNGSTFAAPASFEVTVEQLARFSTNVDLFVGTNLIGTVVQTASATNTFPPVSLTATNIPPGDHQVYAKQRGLGRSFAPGSCQAPIIHVTELGVHSPRVTPSSRFEFDVITSFPTNEHVIETLSNWSNWTSLATNVPFTNTFPFTDPDPATNTQRIYRVGVPQP